MDHLPTITGVSKHADGPATSCADPDSGDGALGQRRGEDHEVERRERGVDSVPAPERFAAAPTADPIGGSVRGHHLDVSGARLVLWISHARSITVSGHDVAGSAPVAAGVSRRDGGGRLLCRTYACPMPTA